MSSNRTILDHDEKPVPEEGLADLSTRYFTWAVSMYGILILFNLRGIYWVSGPSVIFWFRFILGAMILFFSAFGLGLGIRSVIQGERNIGRRYMGIVGNLLLIVTIVLMLFNLLTTYWI